MKYRLPRLRFLLSWLKLQAWQIRNRRLCREIEGLSEKEMTLAHDFQHWKGFLKQRQRAQLQRSRFCQTEHDAGFAFIRAQILAAMRHAAA